MEYTNSLIRSLIEDYIHSERDREVLCYRLIDGLTIEQIATRYQDKHPDWPISADTVKRIIRKQEPILFKHIPG
jgi:hypothetical protein